MVKWIVFILVQKIFAEKKQCDISIQPEESECPRHSRNCIYSRNSVDFLSTCSESTEILEITVKEWNEFGSFNLTIQNRKSADFELIFGNTIPPNSGYFNLKSVKNETYRINAEFTRMHLTATGSDKLDDLDFEVIWAANKNDECDQTCASNLCCHISGDCYNTHQKCDGVWDCADGEDEVGCRRKGLTCNNTEIMCPRIQDRTHGNWTGPECIPIEYVCDGMEDCPTDSIDHSIDEINCIDCANGAFLCEQDSPRRCIAERQLCNGQDDCADGSDETNCPIMEERKVLTAAVVGSLGCCVLFVIALGCTRRLLYVQSVNSCSRARRNLQNLASILQVREAPPTYEAAMGYEPSLMNRPNRNRPWRLTRHGLRRESRRARRRRLPDNTADTSSIDLTSVLQEDGPVHRTESMESIDSQNRESTSNITSPEIPVESPSNPSPAVTNHQIPPHQTSQGPVMDEHIMHELATPTHRTEGNSRTEEEDRKSISSQH